MGVQQGSELGEWRQGEEQRLRARVRVTSQPPRVEEQQMAELISWDCGRSTKLSCPILLGEELTS
jgi:hypothetical protein